MTPLARVAARAGALELLRVAGAIIADALTALVEGRPADPRRATVRALSERREARERSTPARSRKADHGHPRATQTGVRNTPHNRDSK